MVLPLKQVSWHPLTRAGAHCVGGSDIRNRRFAASLRSIHNNHHKTRFSPSIFHDIKMKEGKSFLFTFTGKAWATGFAKAELRSNDSDQAAPPWPGPWPARGLRDAHTPSEYFSRFQSRWSLHPGYLHGLTVSARVWALVTPSDHRFGKETQRFQHYIPRTGCPIAVTYFLKEMKFPSSCY